MERQTAGPWRRDVLSAVVLDLNSHQHHHLHSVCLDQPHDCHYDFYCGKVPHSPFPGNGGPLASILCPKCRVTTRLAWLTKSTTDHNPNRQHHHHSHCDNDIHHYGLHNIFLNPHSELHSILTHLRSHNHGLRCMRHQQHCSIR
jgi:hypothetical protein